MIHRNTAIALVTAGGYLGGALALKALERAGWFPHDTAVRALQVFSGLALALYANFLPKTLGAFRDFISAQRMEQVMRVNGWAFMIGGLGYALTSLLPLPDVVPMAILGTATAYVLGYSAWAFMEHGPRGGAPTA
jgi:hypothetical protein